MACASYTDVLQLDLEEKIQIGDVASKDFPNLNRSHQELSEADGKTGSPIDAGSSSAKGFQAVPETCTIVETGLAEFTQDHSVHEATPQKALSITETLSKETSSVEGSVFTRNQMNFSMGCCNCKHHSEETGTTDKNCLAHSQKATSIENVSVSLDISESGDANQASCSKSDYFSVFSSYVMDASTFIAKHIKVPDYQRDINECFRRLVLENPEAFCHGHALASHNKPCTHNSPTSDWPPVSSNKPRSYTDVLQLDLEEKLQIGNVPSKDFPNLNRSHQELSEADGKTGSPIDTGSSSAKGFQAVPETCTIVETGLAEFTQDHSVHEATPQKALSITETLSKETSSGEGSVFTRNQMNFSMECSNCKHHSEETGTTDKNCLAHSQKATSIENVSVSLDISESGDANQASCSKSDYFSVFSSYVMDASTFIRKHIEFPDYQRDIDEYFRRLILENPEAFCHGHALASHNKPCTHNSPTSDWPPVSSNTPRSTEKSKLVDQALNPTYFSGKSSSKSLSETMKDLENWARKGLENAFNTPLKTDSIDVKDNLVKEFLYGTNLMHEIIRRINNLMRAASTLPVPPTVPLCGFEGGWDQIHDDFTDAALAMWETLHDIRVEAFHDCKTLKLVTYHLSEKRTNTLNCEEQVANLNILITNTCNLVTEKLPLLWKQMRDLREKIRRFCSEMDELL